ncbi:MAG: ABC transporter ATP-binding protein [Chloroflexi bacterium RBG_16_57_9]|nr:MAG: ABC transporter ATP-binding protein [Chloroflexi bacterium RBG_16_57_9]
MLEVKNIDVFYGQAQALWDVSFNVAAGEIVTLVGSNGAGKSTTIKTISGLLTPANGEIAFESQRIDRLPAHEVVNLGIAQIPEGRRLWPGMTVIENLELGAYIARARREREAGRQRVFELFPRLAERRNQLAGTLSGGEQQMLAIGRALLSQPRLLMLDEPSLGLAPVLVEEVLRVIQEINRQGTTILLVEQNVFHALEIANRAYVLETGRVALQGDSHKLLENEYVKTAYLGF